MEESMVMNPEAEQLIFAGRNQFDLIVYYDQNSQSLLDEKNSALGYLRQAIYELEFQKTLQRAPMMLAGGFDAWRSVIGEKGIFKYKSSVSDDQQNNASGSPSYQQQNNNNHWLHPVMADQSPKYTPVKVHHTVYDYVSYYIIVERERKEY
jgi:ubiquitin carboxyl-terminal hydrolase 8